MSFLIPFWDSLYTYFRTFHYLPFGKRSFTLSGLVYENIRLKGVYLSKLGAKMIKDWLDFKQAIILSIWGCLWVGIVYHLLHGRVWDVNINVVHYCLFFGYFTSPTVYAAQGPRYSSSPLHLLWSTGGV